MGKAIGQALGKALASSIHGEEYQAILAFYMLDMFITAIIVSAFLFVLKRLKRVTNNNWDTNWNEIVSLMYLVGCIACFIIAVLLAFFEFSPTLIIRTSSAVHLIVSSILVKLSYDDIKSIFKLRYIIAFLILSNPFTHLFIYINS